MSSHQRDRNAVTKLEWCYVLPHYLIVLVLLTAAIFGHPADAVDTPVSRGKYLVLISGCSDCHTPGHLLGHPDMARFLGGSDVGFGIPGLGVFVGPNLTSDKESGLGKWTAQQIVTAITTGERPDKRILAPAMPWRGLSNLTASDALAIAAFLQSFPPINNKVAGPFGPGEQPNVLVSSVQPGANYALEKAHRPPASSAV